MQGSKMGTRNNIEKARSNVKFMQHSAKWIAILGAVSLGILYVSWLGWSLNYDKNVLEILYEHLRAALGIPVGQ
jgi:hypothetical protein